METIILVLGVSIIFVLIIVGVVIIRKLDGVKGEKLAKELEEKLLEFYPKALNEANEQLVRMSKEQLLSEKREIKTDLINKKTAIEDLVKNVREDLLESKKEFLNSDKDRIGSFNTLAQQLKEQNNRIDQLSITTDGLKRVLSNNQLRGQFGEQVADDLLKMAGFVKGVDYEFNKEQKGSETRPDFAIFLPDKTRINVDSKFPYANLQKSIETDNEQSRKEYFRAFKADIQAKVKQVTSRDYINPEDKTVDFVILFIPNEMIFSYIYDKMNDLWSEAMKKKVIFAGPFSFTAILRMIRQAYDNFRYQQNTQKIIGFIKSFEKEFTKYNDEFVKIGSRIESLSNQYEKVNSTRTRQLIRTIDKIKFEEAEEQPLITTPQKKEKV